MRMMVSSHPPSPGRGDVRLYLKNVFEVRVKSKKSVRKFETPFSSTKRLSSPAILYIHGRKDVDAVRVITWGDAPIPPHDCM